MCIIACGTDVVHLTDVTSFLNKTESPETDVNKWDAFKRLIDYSSEVYYILWNSCDMIAYINIRVGTRSKHVGKGI
jgi:nucleoside-specific outer membrane channel protein Tsx